MAGPLRLDTTIRYLTRPGRTRPGRGPAARAHGRRGHIRSEERSSSEGACGGGACHQLSRRRLRRLSRKVLLGHIRSEERSCRPAPGPGLLRSSLGLTRGGRAAPALLEPPYRRSVSRPGPDGSAWLRRLCLGGFALAPLNPLLPARRLDRRSSQGVCVCGRARAEVDWWAHTRRCRLRGALPPRHRTRPVPGADTGLSVTRAHRPGRLPGFEWLSRRPCRGSAGHQRPTRGTCPAPTPASPTRDAAPHAFQWRGLPGH